jgi:hypothetical protein
MKILMIMSRCFLAKDLAQFRILKVLSMKTIVRKKYPSKKELEFQNAGQKANERLLALLANKPVKALLTV